VEVSVFFDMLEIMEETTPTLMKKLITNAINVPKKAARTTLPNFMMICFCLFRPQKYIKKTYLCRKSQ
jgi:hypothetical protein